MRQLELPTTVFYGDGTWEIINLNPGSIRGDILKNYPLGNPMHGFTLAIESDYLAQKHELHGEMAQYFSGSIDNSDIGMSERPKFTVSPFSLFM